MQLFRSIVPTLTFAALAAPTFGANWIGTSSGDWNWHEAGPRQDAANANWDTDVSPTSGEVVFGDVAGSDPQITVAIDGYPYPEVSDIVFSAANTSYTIIRENGTGSRILTNTQNFTVTDAVQTDQAITAYVGTYAAVNVTNNSTAGTFYFGGYSNGSSGYAQYTSVIDGPGDIVMNNVMQSEQRVLSLEKNGTGTFTVTGTYDFMIGYDGGDSLVQSLITVSEGVLDISGMTLNLEASGGGPSGVDNTALEAGHLVGGEVYTLIDYSAVGAAGLITSGGGSLFGTVNNQPAGWYIADTGEQIVLTDVPEPASTALMLAGASLMLGFRRRSGRN